MRRDYNKSHGYDGMAEMRRDIRILLESLDQDKFPYREFGYTFYVKSEWKITEFLRHDKRIFGDHVADTEEIQDVPRAPGLAAATEPGQPLGPPAPSPRKGPNLRAFFTRFAEGE